MPRKKEYDESLVAEKAMNLFWANGYNKTSARMLEKNMGINSFSIYSSFGSKKGILLESLKTYKALVRKELLIPFDKAPKTVESIKMFFYDFLNFTKEQNYYKGCLLINTTHELNDSIGPELMGIIEKFSTEIKVNFKRILSGDNKKSQELISKQTDYLFIALQGLLSSAKINDPKQIENYVEMTFLGI